MGLQSELNAAISEAFDTDLNDAVQGVDLVVVTRIHDPVEDAFVVGEALYSTRAVIQPVQNRMVDGEAIRASDSLFTILQSELNYAPLLADIIRVSGIDYSINFVKADPANVTWELVARRV